MNSHKNAGTTYAGRKLPIERVKGVGLIPALRKASKWLQPSTDNQDCHSERGAISFFEAGRGPVEETNMSEVFKHERSFQAL
jgi:hypothetical protein